MIKFFRGSELYMPEAETIVSVGVFGLGQYRFVFNNKMLMILGASGLEYEIKYIVDKNYYREEQINKLWIH